jgi:hypothetical protein
VGRDASIQWILESFRDDRFQGEPSSIVCTFYIPEEKQYHRAKRISDRTASIEELFQQQDIQIVYNFD